MEKKHPVEDKVLMLSLEELRKDNHLNHQGPIIAICADWMEAADGRYSYSDLVLNEFIDKAKQFGVKLHFLGYEELIAPELRGKIHGLLISGGRDIHPKFYGQEINGSIVHEVDSVLRWQFMKHFVFESDPKMPIFGVC